VTEEQTNAINTILDPDCSLLKISAVSGSGKTHTLVGIAEKLKPNRALYIAFNKAIALEAKLKFPYYVDCRTIHSLAYMYIIKDTNREIDFFTARNIKERLPYAKKLDVVAVMEEFFNSSEISLSFFDQYDPDIATTAKKYINLMVDAKIPCTFGFLLKYFHLQLQSGAIVPPTYDLLMLDEAGDTTGVILEVFKLMPATKKVMVGDPQQNIYSFMHTINGFEALYDEGKLLPLSKSFRVSEEIAEQVEHFCHAYLDTNMVFKGSPQLKKSETFAYISRTNSMLIERMIKLNKKNEQYCLTRDAKEIFSLILTLINLKRDSVIYDRRYKFLVDELIEYEESPEHQRNYDSFRSFLMSNYGEEPSIKQACNILNKYSISTIYDTYNRAKSMPKRAAITLTTAHSSKGCEYDEVYIEEDLNTVIAKCNEATILTNEIQTEYRLYYVACTRARLKLHNADMLNLNNIDHYINDMEVNPNTGEVMC
jgi:superfamily I DNA/RNA helicase